MTAVRKTIRIAADPGAVLAIVADVHNYPRLQAEVDRVDVLAADERGRPSRATVWIKAAGRTGSYTLAYEYPEPNEIRYRLLDSDLLAHHDACFRVTAVDGGSELSVELALEPKWPMPGLVVGALAGGAVARMVRNVRSLAEAGRRR